MIDEFLPERVKASTVTKAPAKSAPTNAQKLTGEINAKIPLERTLIDPAAIIVLAVTAPSVAPEEMPIIPGSASGFLKNS